ncbi:MAG: oxidoreductase [Burkholderiaceae bacterium]|nr:oxidoreductase [Microbacteriaceae bacterium]
MSFFSDVERSLVVRSRRIEADGVVSLELAPANGRDLPVWTAGSHIDLRLPDGVERQYSLCGDPADRSAWRIAVLLEPHGRGGSAYVHADIREGQTVRVRGPRNHFSFAAAPGERVALIAGGIGITPILAMATAAEAAGADWTLDYSGRSRATMAFVDELRGRYGERVRLHPSDEGNRLDLSALAAFGGQLYCCGPTRLLDAVEAAGADLAPGAVHVERFEAKEFGEPVWTESFEVEFVLSGLTLTVPPGRSILQVAEENDVLVPASCRSGTCGTCETPVLEGEVEHRDSILTPEERSQNTLMMVCVSRAACPRLLLDL